MFSKAKHIFLIKREYLVHIKRYASDKNKNLEKTLVKNKKSESTIITENYEECTEFEAKVVKQVLIEKEKDASLQSRLSKNCKHLFNNPTNSLSYSKYGLINVEHLQKAPECPEWGTYSFDHLKNLLEGGQPPVAIKAANILSDANAKASVSGTGAGGNSGSSETFKRRKREEQPGKVIFTFIPEEWWRAFIPITGVTGFGTFLFTFGTFLVSKEIYVLEHYYYHGLGAFFYWILLIKYIGPHLTPFLDKEIDEYEKSWNEARQQQKKGLEDDIMHEFLLQLQSEGQLMLIAAKRENVQLQLEEEYRKRKMHVYKEVISRLDYQVALVAAKHRIQQKNLVEYVTREVSKAITPEMQIKLINYSIDQIVEDLNKQDSKK